MFDVTVIQFRFYTMLTYLAKCSFSALYCCSCSPFQVHVPGWTGAKLAQLMQESALVAVRNHHDSILQSDVDEAVDRLTVGPKRVGMELGHQGQCRRAATEVGVALTAHLLRRFEDAKVEQCERISIIPRGQVQCLFCQYV